MSTESKNKWRLLHELVLKAKEAKNFETLGAVVEELSSLRNVLSKAPAAETASYYAALSDAFNVAWKKLCKWQENPPPTAPQETQIGPGNPFPPPPPPPPTVAGEEFISLEFLLHLVKEAKSGSGDCFALWLPRLCEELNRWASANPKTPKVEQGKWTGALVFERIAPRGLTNPVGYRAATPDEQAELDRMARAINRNTPLFEPTPQAPGSLDALRKTIVCAITNEKEAVNGQYGGADVGLLLNALVRMVDKAFADYAAQNAKAIERAAEHVKTPEPWTGESLYAKAYADVDGLGDGKWSSSLTPMSKQLWNKAADIANERMGSTRSPLKPWTAEQFYLQFGPPDWRPGTVTSVRLGTAQREACEKAAAVINKWAGLDS